MASSVNSAAKPENSRKAPDTEVLSEKISIRNLDFFYDGSRALKNINLTLYAKRVTAIIGPSGCGKSTLLRVLNRMYDLYPGQRATGEVLLDGANILSPEVDLNLLRSRVGMVFQKPTPFPMSIYENIAFGIRLYERLRRSELDGRVELALRRAALWEEVKEKLGASGQKSLRRPATASVHCPYSGSKARSHPLRRAMFSTRSNLNSQDRGTDRRVEGGIHHCRCDAQHAAGCPHFGLYCLHVSR